MGATMTDGGSEAGYQPDDAQLLSLLRAGDAGACDLLYQRHQEAARRFARCLVPADDVDNLVAETFDKIRDVTMSGGGPFGTFRLHMLTVLRRISKGQRGPHAAATDDSAELIHLGLPFTETRLDEMTTSPVVRAFWLLPDRCIDVLWHTEIDQTPLPRLSEILDLYPDEVFPLRSRAGNRLRQAYLELLQVEDSARPECRPILECLPAFVSNDVSGDDSEMVAEHLYDCDECSAMCDELADVDTVAMREVVAPAILGSAAGEYLAAVHAAVTGRADASGLPRLRHAARRARHGILLAAGAVAVVTALVTVLAWPASPGQQPQAATVRKSAGTPSQSPRPGGSSDPTAIPSPALPPTATPSAAPRRPSAASSPSRAPRPSPAPRPSATPGPSPTSGPSPTPQPPCLLFICL
jgi:DNA-directed RNA polymerase specialized sigma24 family protein